MSKKTKVTREQQIAATQAAQLTWKLVDGYANLLAKAVVNKSLTVDESASRLSEFIDLNEIEQPKAFFGMLQFGTKLKPTEFKNHWMAIARSSQGMGHEFINGDVVVDLLTKPKEMDIQKISITIAKIIATIKSGHQHTVGWLDEIAWEYHPADRFIEFHEIPKNILNTALESGEGLINTVLAKEDFV